MKKKLLVLIGVATGVLVLVGLEGNCDGSISYFTNLGLAVLFGIEGYFSYKLFSKQERKKRKSYHEWLAILNAIMLTCVIFAYRNTLLVNCCPFKGGPVGGGEMLIGVFLEAVFVFLVSKTILERVLTKRK